MSFIRLMLDGVPESHKREKYPKDTIEAKESTYDYSGKVTNEFYIPYLVDDKDVHGNQYKVCIVDGAVQVKVAAPEQRKAIKVNLDGNATKANATAFAGGAGFVYSLYKMATCDYVYGLGVLASLGVAGLAVRRSSEATAESMKWDDPVKNVCHARRDASKKFNTLMKRNLRGSHFTSDETKHVFHDTMSSLSEEHNNIMSGGDPKNIELWVQRFVKENPMYVQSLNYAFPNESEISNPKELDNGKWKRDDLNMISAKSRRLLNEFSLFQTETQNQLETIERNQEAVNTAVNSTNMFTQVLIDGSVNSQLHQNENEKWAKFNELNEESHYSHHERKMKDIEDKHKQASMQTIHEGQKNKLLSTGATLFATHLSNLYGSATKESVRIDRRGKLIQKFPSEIDDILNDYSSKRHRMGNME